MSLKDKMQVYTLDIVLVGSFNPVIFQPAWLANKGLIREQEAEEVSNLKIIDQQLVTFSFDWADFQITADRFEIKTSKEPYHEIVKDLVIGIFDKYLRETPIRAIGINHISHYLLTQDDYYKFGDKLVPLSNWSSILPEPKLLHLEILNNKREDGKEGYQRVRVTPSDIIPSNGLAININDHYDNKDSTAAAKMMKIFIESWDYSMNLSTSISEHLWKTISQ